MSGGLVDPRPTWKDRLFGPVQDETRDRSQPVEFQLPERSYDTAVVISTVTWSRPRWPWWPLRKRVTVGRFVCQEGIPIPRKDRTQDYLYEVQVQSSDVQEILKATLARIQLVRESNGGESWFPLERKRQSYMEALMTPQQRRAKKRLAAGKRQFRPVPIEDGKYEVHPDLSVYERVPVKGGGGPYRLRKVDEQTRRAIIATVGGGEGDG